MVISCSDDKPKSGANFGRATQASATVSNHPDIVACAFQRHLTFLSFDETCIFVNIEPQCLIKLGLASNKVASRSDLSLTMQSSPVKSAREVALIVPWTDHRGLMLPNYALAIKPGFNERCSLPMRRYSVP